MCKAGPTEAGYTYVAMLVVLVALALAAQVTFVPTATDLRRAAEEELIFRGRAYARAIESYYDSDPGPQQFPQRLEDLLDDPRSDGLRHIRRLYESGTGAPWQEMEAAAGGIMGVSVTSPWKPFRRSQLPAGVFIEENSDGYAEWQFVADVDGP
jgi:hypothetical protein